MNSMKGCVRLDGLLLSSDAEVLSVMNQILDTFAIDTEICNDFGTALDAVTHRRLDAVVVDWEGANNPTRVVNAARKSSPNNTSMIVSMVSENSEMQAALLAGANFIIHKPTSLDHATRCMRAAYGTMLQQRRRAARCAVDIPVIPIVAELGRLEGKIVDISIGGLALRCNRPLQINWTISLNFLLPSTTNILHVTGRVVNTDETGRAGICFSFVPEEEFNMLVNWLATELAKLETVQLPFSDFPGN